MKLRHVFRAALASATFSIGATGHALVAFNAFTDPHPAGLVGGTIGFTYFGDGFVGSVQGDGTGRLYRTDLSGNNVQVFAPTVNLPGGGVAMEHFVASSLGLAGFPSRDVYVAAGDGIIHIDHAGAAGAQFITSVNGVGGSSLASAVRGILFDAIGTFGHDMLVTTTGGEVYQVTSVGAAKLLASTGEDTEGLDIAPLGTFGPYAGQLFVASEGSGLLRAITTMGIVTVINANSKIPGAEELTFVPFDLGLTGNPVEGLYAARFTNDVVKANASEFASMLGDIIVTSESTTNVWDVKWNGTTAAITMIGSFTHPEDGILVTAAIINPTPEPSSLLLLSAALLGVVGAGVLRRKKARVA
jgi:hypothetical protein